MTSLPREYLTRGNTLEPSLHSHWRQYVSQKWVEKVQAKIGGFWGQFSGSGCPKAEEIQEGQTWVHKNWWLTLCWLCIFIQSAWDDETVDHWHIEKFQEGDMAHPLTEESSFATLFPKYREKYLQKVWPHVERVLRDHVCCGHVHGSRLVLIIGVFVLEGIL